MNYQTDINAFSDQSILSQIGDFVKQTRIKQNITQEELANKSTISRSTLSLLERGENISLLNLIKVLRILDVLYVLEDLSASPQISPLLLAREPAFQRQRARSNPKNKSNEEDLGW